MSRKLSSFFLPLFCLTVLACAPKPAANPPNIKRIVSLAPNITETMFALGLGGQLAGVTRYCDYPAAAKKLPKVGGYMDPAYEAIVALRPDLVILLSSHQKAAAEFRKLKIKTVTIPHTTLADIHSGILLIGKAGNVELKARNMVQGILRRAAKVRRTHHGKTRPRVLICIGRDTQSGKLTGLYMAGQKTYYDEILSMAGGVNALSQDYVQYPELSAEGVIQVNPDVIVDLISHMDPKKRSKTKIAAQWSRLSVVSAVKNKRVYAVFGYHALRPGPRYIEFLEELAGLLHP